jgi:hypothetical protein
MPVILATWEAEIRRMQLKVSLGKKYSRPHLNQYLGVVTCACHPSCYGKHEIRGSQSRLAQAKSKIIS